MEVGVDTFLSSLIAFKATGVASEMPPIDRWACAQEGKEPPPILPYDENLVQVHPTRQSDYC